MQLLDTADMIEGQVFESITRLMRRAATELQGHQGIVPPPEIRQWALTQSAAAMVNWKDMGEWIDAAEAIAQYVCNGKKS